MVQKLPVQRVLTCCNHAPSAGQTGTASSLRKMEFSTCVQTIRYSWYPLYSLFEAGFLCQALGTLSVDSFLTKKKRNMHKW